MYSAHGDLRHSPGTSQSARPEDALPEDFRLGELRLCYQPQVRVARDATRMSKIAEGLRLTRFHLSIDDFGTGQSGLSQLRTRRSMN